jgi:bisphosphoglycerate-dependent phosphoglycerate mutase
MKDNADHYAEASAWELLEQYDAQRPQVSDNQSDEPLRDAVQALMAYWSELDNIAEETLDEHEIIVSARQMKKIRELL